jgi:hypothetical protein
LQTPTKPLQLPPKLETEVVTKETSIMATRPEPLGEHPITKTSKTPEMVNIDIATEGDVIFVLQQTRIRVSSAILASASPVFKAMFGPNFAEGQGDRSAQNPKEITLPDDDASATTILCRLMHHQYKHNDLSFFVVKAAPESTTQLVQDFFTLATVADKYGCADMARVMGASLLSELGSTSLYSFFTAETLITLAAATYTIADCYYFALFTRRLVLDYAMSYSCFTKHHALGVLPSEFLRKHLAVQDESHVLTTMIVYLEEQRKAAVTTFRLQLFNSVQQKWCQGCGRGDGERAIPGVLAALMTKAYDSCTFRGGDCVGLRSVMKRASECGDVLVPCCSGITPGFETRVQSIEFKALNRKVNKIVCGLCLTCLREGSDTGECTHRQLLRRCVKNDPIF